MLPTRIQINTLRLAEACALLDGLYEHSPWVVERTLKRALPQRPFTTLAQLKAALAHTVSTATLAEQLALLRAHPELAGKAMVDNSLTAESSHEQQQAGLTHCTPAEFEQLHALNAAYKQRFGFPFILAVRGPRGTGLGKREIISTLERRLQAPPAMEHHECLRQVHRIAEIRLNERLGYTPTQGERVWDWLESLAQHTEATEATEAHDKKVAHPVAPPLTVTYLSDAHRACAQQIAQDMRSAGCDSVHMDAVGNVVGLYQGTEPLAPRLLTGSHYDTVRNGGKYDGRLGIYVPLACVHHLAQNQQRLPHGLEIVAFAEEEGQRYKATFLASSALTGTFDPAWLAQTDANGIRMDTAMQQAGLSVQDIASLRRDPAQYLGFVEVHIEQGPVLHSLNLPLGVVTSINASVRYQIDITGVASHAGTTPMHQRHDAAAAAAEMVLYIEQRAAQDADSVGTVGMLQVPQGSINVVPGRCLFSIDLRAPSDAQRDALARDVLAQLSTVCQRRGVHHTVQETMRASAAPSDPLWQSRWEHAVTTVGVPLHRMPSGAGHDAMKIHNVLPQAMLFVRGENGGISHNPLESTTCDDMQIAVDAFFHLLCAL